MSRATGPTGPVLLQRRILHTTILQTAIVVVVAAVLVAATQVRVALGTTIDEWGAIYVILGTTLSIAQVYLVILTRKGRLVEVRHWTWLLLPVHLAWGSGVFVGIRAALPIGIGLALFDLMLLIWLKDAEDIDPEEDAD